MKMILLGPPGAGKGTQAEILCRMLHIPTISTGNILRQFAQKDTPEGRATKELLEAGKLVDDQIILGILKKRLARPDCRRGYILDGVPRNIAQAEALEKDGIILDEVLSIEISDQEIERRVVGRRVCLDCGATFHLDHNPPKDEGVCDKCSHQLVQRADDMAEPVRNRLHTYHSKTEPLKEFYRQRGVLKVVQNQPTIAATTRVILDVLGL